MTQVHPSRRSRLAVIGSAGALALAGSVVAALPAGAGGNACENRNNNTVSKALECVTVEGVTEHLQALQAIADANGGTRASGTPGFTASADYVETTLEAAGYTVTRQPFSFPFYDVETSAFERTGPTPTTYTEEQYAVATYAGNGDVTAAVTPVDLTIPPGPTAGSSTSGCEAADFAGFPAGTIALVQRGTCDFSVKVTNAIAAGAAGVVIFNEGQEGRQELLSPTLGAPLANGVPVVGVSYQTGVDLSAAGTTVRIAVEAESGTRDTENVIAELPGRTDEVVQVGAHLDSVPEGPGINDDGSGSAAILELAENVRKAKFAATVRFSWWGAEEAGLLGSAHYVEQLPQAEIDRISAYLNFDMIGSPNFVRFVYDSDGQDFESTPAEYVSDRSTQIENTFERFYADRGLANENTEFDGRSDYQAFADAGVPSGGLFTGAEGVKTPEQAAVYGGTAGEWYDPCYHQACDSFNGPGAEDDNLDYQVLDENSDAVAYATLVLAGAR